MLLFLIFLFVCYGLNLKEIKSINLNTKSLKDKLLKGSPDKQKKISEKLKILDKKDKYGAKFDMKNNSTVYFDNQN
jgi:hypothetical protein